MLLSSLKIAFLPHIWKNNYVSFLFAICTQQASQNAFLILTYCTFLYFPERTLMSHLNSDCPVRCGHSSQLGGAVLDDMRISPSLRGPALAHRQVGKV